MPMWLAPCALALLFRWRFCFAFLFAFRCFVGLADAGSLFLPDTFRKQMVRGGFCAKKYRATAAVSRENSLLLSICSCLLGLAWFYPLDLVRLACFIWYVASVFSIACNTYISLIKAWCLYDNGKPAFCTTHFQSVSAARNEVLILNHIFHECLPELLTNV